MPTTPRSSSPQSPAAAAPPPRAAHGSRVRQVPAVSRSIAILRLLGDNKQGMGVKAIADALQLVPSTCLHILRVLVSEDLVQVDAATKRYALSGGMIALARSVLGGSSFSQLMQPALDRIASRFSATAMGVEITARQGAVVLALSKSNQPFRLHTDVGSQFDEIVSATGRLIAAYGQDNWTQLRKRFQAVTWDKAPSFERWRQEVEQARALGWSVDRDHFVVGLTVVAVPIFDNQRRMTHTLVAAGLSSQLQSSQVTQLAAAMQQEAAALSDMLLARG